MVVVMRRIAAALCLLFVAGCVTDELVVYKDTVLSTESMKPYLGMYQVKEWVSDTKPKSIRVTEADGEFRFSYSLLGQDIQARFIVSKIPASRKGLHLISLPSQEDTDQANMFFIGKVEKEAMHIWLFFRNLPVAQERLEFTDGKAEAEAVRSFLSNHADAFVGANEPQIVLEKMKR